MSTAADPQLVAALADAARREVEARATVREGQRRAREAMREQAALLRELRTLGVAFTSARLALALGVAPTRAARQRLGARLRRVLWRVSNRDANRWEGSASQACERVGLKVPARMDRDANKEQAMAKLLKRVIEIYAGGEELDEEGAEGAEGLGGIEEEEEPESAEDEDEAEEEPEAKPKKPRK